jgi:hypothetical protein
VNTSTQTLLPVSFHRLISKTRTRRRPWQLCSLQSPGNVSYYIRTRRTLGQERQEWQRYRKLKRNRLHIKDRSKTSVVRKRTGLSGEAMSTLKYTHPCHLSETASITFLSQHAALSGYSLKLRLLPNLSKSLKKWRKRVRVERTGDGQTRRPPVLKTGRITGPHALPELRLLGRATSVERRPADTV